MYRVIAGTVLVFAAASCVASSGDDLPRRPPSVVTFEGTEATLYVRIADTPETRRRGLMGVERLPDDEGMAFVFDEPVTSTFWMKDTPLPLSIAFVGGDGRIVSIRDMEPCPGDPCPRFGADGPFTLAIEANRGWFEEHGVEVGNVVELRQRAYA